MRSGGSLVALVALASTALATIVKIPVARNAPGTVRRRSPKLSKRATVTESLINNITYGGYFASVSVGTPGQDITLTLDTGSSDAFVLSSKADLCTEKVLQVYYDTTCGPTFNSADSSSFQNTGEDFRIQYADGSGAIGTYITDNLVIGGKTIKNLQMGLASRASMGIGILGIGFDLNEAAEVVYPNLIDELVKQGFISTQTYSLYLNDYYSSTGSIIFGGVDTDKFIGNLVVVPILPDAETGNYTSFTVGLTGLSFTFPNDTDYKASLASETDDSLNIILDSGTTLTYLPEDIATPLFDAVGAYIYTSFSDSTGVALIDCNLDATFSFRINNAVTITVPSSEFVIDAFAGDPDEVPSGSPFQETCVFGIQNIGNTDAESGSGLAKTADYAIFGDTFLRSAYVVYDLTNLQIGLAQANLNSTDSNVKELDSSASSLPVFSGVASQTVVSTSTGTSTLTSGTSTASGTGSSSGTSTATGTAAGSSTSATSSHNAAALGRGTPGYDGLVTIVGLSVAFTMSGGLLFWL